MNLDRKRGKNKLGARYVEKDPKSILNGFIFGFYEVVHFMVCEDFYIKK